MKKVILSISAMLFGTAMCLAQSTAPHGATASGFVSHYSSVMSTGNGNDATISQVGTQHQSNVIQDGKNGLVLGDGWKNEAWVTQTGLNQVAIIGSHGDKNDARIVQKNQFNIAEIDQGVGYSEKNSATAMQDGNRNESMQKQRYDRNSALVVQTGWRNEAVQDQSTEVNSAKGSNAVIRQDGGRNRAVQTQKGEKNDARTVQTGMFNDSNTIQTGDKNSDITNQFGDYNKALTIQTGIMNEAITRQNGDLNMSDITQTGDKNFARVRQFSNSNISTITQLGNNNGANVFQN
jgi:hypothetical protein